jgi:hypothetical protein
MNPFSGLMHKVKIHSSEKGPLLSSKPKRPQGMSGRQWKKAKKAARRRFNNRTDEFAGVA